MADKVANGTHHTAQVDFKRNFTSLKASEYDNTDKANHNRYSRILVVLDKIPPLGFWLIRTKIKKRRTNLTGHKITSLMVLKLMGTKNELEISSNYLKYRMLENWTQEFLEERTIF